MASQIQIRRDTAANWTTANPILAQGEQGHELDTYRFKIGDGVTAWTALRYILHDTRVQSTASTATLTPNVNLYDMAVITAQAEALAIAAPTGTPSNGNAFAFRLSSAGAYAITFNPIYRAIGSAFPTTTTSNKTLYFVAVYNSTDTKWDVFPSNLEV